MDATQILKENTELYVRGKLEGADLHAFEKRMSDDKSLASEVELQRNIQTVINNHRISVLKHRLNQIPVSPATPIANASKFSILKVAALLVASVGLGTYYYIQSTNLSEKELAAPNVVTNPEPRLEKNAIPQIKEHENVTENINVNVPTSIESKYIAQKAKPNVNSYTIESAKKVPNMEAFVDESQANVTSDNNELPKPDEVESLQLVAASDVDIKNIQDGAHNFHYKFQNKVLFLYGSFDASPYEILEFNDKSSQILYLYYDKSFFEMNSNTEEIVKLKKITDKNVIAKLDIARIR